VQVWRQEHRHLAAGIFDYRRQAVLIPEIKKHWEAHSYRNARFLMLDNGSGDTNRNFEDLCASCRLLPVFLLSHSSNQTEVLGLSISGLMKCLITQANRVGRVKLGSFHIAHTACSLMSGPTQSTSF
jgi:hypothetical protein